MYTAAHVWLSVPGLGGRTLPHIELGRSLRPENGVFGSLGLPKRNYSTWPKPMVSENASYFFQRSMWVVCVDENICLARAEIVTYIALVREFGYQQVFDI
jgi:hypothetical protein